MEDFTIRRAPSGKFYAVWHGCPVCRDDGSLRYFDSEDDARSLLKSGTLVLQDADGGAAMPGLSFRAGRARVRSFAGPPSATKPRAAPSLLSLVKSAPA